LAAARMSSGQMMMAPTGGMKLTRVCSLRDCHSICALLTPACALHSFLPFLFMQAQIEASFFLW
jgi:hypothetical protein